jgi:hypothetical protein
MNEIRLIVNEQERRRALVVHPVSRCPSAEEPIQKVMKDQNSEDEDFESNVDTSFKSKNRFDLKIYVASLDRSNVHTGVSLRP